MAEDDACQHVEINRTVTGLRRRRIERGVYNPLGNGRLLPVAIMLGNGRLLPVAIMFSLPSPASHHDRAETWSATADASASNRRS